MITGLKIQKVNSDKYLEDMITNMKFKINFDDVKTDESTVSVEFTFTANYEGGSDVKPMNVAQLNIVGTVDSKNSNGELDIVEIEQLWKTKKTLPIKFAEDIINLLNFECGARGTLLASSIGLLAPLAMSRAKLNPDGSDSKFGFSTSSGMRA
jgi:hypothetical protein